MKSKGLGLSLGLVLLACMVTHLHAGEVPFGKGSIYLTPTIGGILYLDDSEVDVDHSFIAGGRLGYFLTDHISLEGDFDYSWTQFNGPPSAPKPRPYDGLNANHYFILTNALYHFDPIGEKLSPYVLGGIGWGHLETSRFGEDGFAGNVGLGLHYAFNDYLLLRCELRYLGLTNPQESNLVGSVGLTLHLGKEEKAPPPPPPPPPKIRDFDEDGVPDHLDKCPTTPKGCLVDEEGCPLDSDRDGVCDGIDACGDTPLGQTVDEKGCPVAPEKVTIGWSMGLRFKLGSAELTKDAEKVLDQFLEIAKKYPKYVIEIGGYTDSTGSPTFNKRLSEKRAMAVRNYLVLRGFTPDRLIPIGYGATNFVADNSTPEGRAKNRRVEFKFLGENALGLKVLHFKAGKDELTETSKKDLKEIAEILKAHPDVHIEIAAYTDSSGPASLNKRLSQKRAEAVRDMLVAMGVKPEMLKPVGYGETNFLTTNATPEGRAMNRRVELKVLWR